jgi:phospholipid/cholesterol/gamma-HCH transport system substrate-binding protein
MKRAIKNHLGDFLAILVLLILAIAISGYVLSKERLRFPLIQPSPFKLNAEFSTGQAVTPGQGQTVRVSGVQIGDIGKVSLKNGRATVELALNEKYKHVVHEDWTALLRPKTGLKDMFVELSPPIGGSHAPLAKEGFTIPIQNTMPDVNPDEILSALDSDTRAYLDLLVNGAGQGLKGKGGSELAQVFERFEPTHRDLARLNSVVARRGSNLRRLIHSLQVLNGALAQKSSQIVQLVDASSKVFRAFAAENQNVSQAVADLPGTLRQATITLQKVQRFAQILAPATRDLLPAVQAIPAANFATINLARPAEPIIRTQVRPFVIAARPVVRHLRPAAVNLAAATPNLNRVFTVLNHLFNLLGYYPSGNQHGYLWWLAWLDHNARTVFSVQDANGDFRPLFLQASCATYAQVVQNFGGAAAEAFLNLTPILTSAQLCPKQSAADAKAYDRYKQQQQQPQTKLQNATGIHAAGDQSGSNGSNAENSAPSYLGVPNNLFYPKLPGN